MIKSDEFYTLKGYQLTENPTLTAAMEDYLEMIYRMTEDGEAVHIRDLSEHLNVRPSSSSKMVRHLMLQGYISSGRYSTLTLTEKGITEGEYLLYRHNVVNSFLCAVNSSSSMLEETEKIEHFLSRETVYNLDRLTKELHKKNTVPGF